MRVHCFQHVPFEGLGSIEPWLLARGHTITRTGFFAGEPIPDPASVDMLVVMGGPMSVNDETDHPWLKAEKAFVRDIIATGKPVLGICLGAQLIASALGARVYPNREREIGWLPIAGVSGDEGFRLPPQSQVFQWHGETFDLPPGARLLATSPACTNQAFQLGERVIGLQFHLETTPQSAAALVSHCGDELVPAAWVQSGAQILAAGEQAYQDINGLMSQVLSYLTGNLP